MNKVILLGRLCQDPELKYVGEKNIAITKFTLAVNRSYKNAQGEYDTDFINCYLWDKKAETFCKYTHKGKLVSIEGSLRIEKYTNENDENIYSSKIHIDNFYFIPSTKNQNNNTYNSNEIFTDEVFDGEISESDIPF